MRGTSGACPLRDVRLLMYKTFVRPALQCGSEVWTATASGQGAGGHPAGGQGAEGHPAPGSARTALVLGCFAKTVACWRRPGWRASRTAVRVVQPFLKGRRGLHFGTNLKMRCRIGTLHVNALLHAHPGPAGCRAVRGT
jgi:hypothetical protein